MSDSNNPPSVGDTWDQHLERTLSALRKIYDDYIRPCEERYKYDVFRPSWFSETIVQKKPFVLFIGPFSAGKSTFVNYLLQSNLLVTGPQPTTDKFTVILQGEELEQISGRVLVSDCNQPFRGLQQFGDSFIESLNAIRMNHPILNSVSLIDTPGVLEAAADVRRRRYDYIQVMKWFVERSDLVFVMFDPTKLDTGSELRLLFKHALRGNERKLRIILNKADTISAQELMRVYGALFWSLSSLISATEPPRVYVSSFWDQPYKPNTNHELFNDEKADLIYDLTDNVPRQSLDARVGSVLRRATDVYMHGLLCATMSSRLPTFFGVKKASEQQLRDITRTCRDLSEEKKVAENNFGSPEEYDKFFKKVPLKTMPSIEKQKNKGILDKIQYAMNQLLPQLLKPIKDAPVSDPRDSNLCVSLEDRLIII